MRRQKKDVRELEDEPVPLVIRNAPTKLMAELHYGEGYQYAHSTAEKDDENAVPSGLPEGQDLTMSLRTRGRKW